MSLNEHFINLAPFDCYGGESEWLPSFFYIRPLYQDLADGLLKNQLVESGPHPMGLLVGGPHPMGLLAAALENEK